MDILMEELNQRLEVDDFVKYGIYPSRLKSTFTKKIIPHLEENPLEEYPLEEYHYINERIHEDLDNMLQSLHNVEEKLKEEQQREITKKSSSTHTENECPICMDQISDRNYVMPVCGHCVCVSCFVTNLKINKQTGHICSLCRHEMT
jgi:hypothetical protein|tara:strand:+ start:149 stop:589 length:441 start_codon:yes stop_codon:yes gene_type:complete